MNCHDAREAFSARADATLAPEARAAVAAHLDHCADCRRELVRFEATLALLRRVERPRAPAGFVDRVLEAASPLPWHRRLLRRLFLPLGVKLPAEAAALLLVAGLAVLVFQRTPGLRDAARDEMRRAAPSAQAPPGAAPAPGTPPAAVAPPAGVPPPSSAPAFRDRSEVRTATPGDTREAEGQGKKSRIARENAAPPERAKWAAPGATSTAPPAPSSAVEPGKETARGGAVAPAAREAAPGPSSPEPPSPPGRTDRASQAPLEAAAPRPPEPSVAAGRLTVRDREAAERDLRDALARAGGTVLSRREDAAGLVLELLLPPATYQQFAHELTRIGAWSPEAARSESGSAVRLTLRLVP